MSLSKPSTSGETIYTHKVLHKQARAMVFSVYNFFKTISDQEIRNNTNFARCRELTAKACLISEHSVTNIVKEGKQSNKVGCASSFISPGKHRTVKKRKTNLDDFEKCVLRRTIFDLYDKGEYPTAKKLVALMRDKIEYKGSVSSMYTILKSLGFKYRRTNDGRKFLLERGDIVAARQKFLRTLHNLRRTGDTRPIFYLDETWVNQNHSRKDIWQDSTGRGGLKIPIGKGSRLIICHAGSAKTGFIPESKWVFRSSPKCKNTDYHSEMNAESFKEWFVNRFLYYLDGGSIIIMDNASYHSRVLNKLPTTNSRKKEIQEWLQNHEIAYDPTETTPELLARVALYKTREKICELDEIALEMGHEVIRLPAYHCQYNPIEMIWAKVKGEVAELNNTFRLADVERLTNDRVTREDWESRVAHVEKLQEDDFEKEVARDDTIESVIINLRDSESDTDASDEGGDEEEGEKEDEEVLAVPL